MKILDNEPKEMRPMSPYIDGEIENHFFPEFTTNKVKETNTPKKRAEYLITLQLLDDIKSFKVPAKELYNILTVFIGDDDITGLLIYKTNYKTTTVKID